LILLQKQSSLLVCRFLCLQASALLQLQRNVLRPCSSLKVHLTLIFSRRRRSLHHHLQLITPEHFSSSSTTREQ
jgi:hypothetical protein